MLKQYKIITLAPICFGSCRNHSQGAVLCLAKTTNMGFSVLVNMDSVNIMAAYEHLRENILLNSCLTAENRNKTGKLSQETGYRKYFLLMITLMDQFSVVFVRHIIKEK
jgi:hypothetical protein